MLQTILTERLQIRHPLLLAPMATVSGGKLAAAVSKAGGLGLIGGGYGKREWLLRQFEIADGERVGVGFITWSLAQDPSLLDLVLARKPAAVMLSFGDPAPFAEKVRNSGTPLICQVQSLTEAEEAKAVKADLIVAQGTEAGGHGGRISTFALLPAVTEAVSPIPVVAAGGIVDGRGTAAALMFGACGVLVGTRFFASHEALGHQAAKQCLLEAGSEDTLRTTVFDLVRELAWPSQYSGRALRNRFSERWHGNEQELLREQKQPERPVRVAAEYQRAVEQGNFEQAAVFAGEGVGQIISIESAETLVHRIIREAEDILAQKR